MMKKLFAMGVIACAALSMASCSNDELASGATAEGNAIEFGTYWGRNAEARASVIDNAALQAKGFGVFAFYTAQDGFKGTEKPNFMNNQKVEYSNSAWTYSPLKYWPNNTGDKVSFFAYAPYETGKTWVDGAKLGFTVASTVTDQTDLLFCPGLVDETKAKVGDKLIFKFNHALSKVGFNVAYAADQVEVGGTLDGKTNITVQSVTLSNVFSTTGNVLMNDATKDGENSYAKWEIASDVAKQGYTLAESNFTDVKGAVTSAFKQLNKDDSYLMIIPETVTFDVTIKYTVTTEDANLTNNDGKSVIENTITNTVTGFEFKPNKAYTFNLLLGMTSVKIDAEYVDWENGGETKVDLPVNTK